MMKRWFLYLIFGLLVIWGPMQASGTVVQELSFDEITHKADTIVVVKVVSKKCEWESDKRQIWTTVGFRVQQTITGQPKRTLLFKRFLGGTVGDITTRVDEIPQFYIGENLILFLYDNQRLYCPMVGWKQGKYIIVKDSLKRQVILNSERKEIGVNSQRKIQSLPIHSQPTTLQQFLDMITHSLKTH